MSTKQELFRKVLARSFTIRDVIYDHRMLRQMRDRDWVFSGSRGFMEHRMNSRYHPDVLDGGPEWQEDVISSLRDLGRI